MRTVLLTVDALRADHLGQYGYDRDTMPALDRLEAEGTRYEAAFANGPYTGVSLPSMLTSRYFGQTPASEGPTVASVLREQGVATAGFHSNAMLANAVGEVAGFETFEDFDVTGEADDRATGDASITERTYRRLVETVRPVTEALGVRPQAERIQEAVFPAEMIHSPSVYTDAQTTTDAALSWLDGAPEEFFLWIHYMDPHRPYGTDLDDPAFADRVPDDDELLELMSKAGVHPGSVTDAERRRIVDLYDSDVRYTSDAVDLLFDGLVERGIWDETALVFTADHGEEFGEHGRYFHRNHPYDELLHAPLCVKPPAGTRGGDTLAADDVVAETRELLDVAPTICALHGVDAPPSFRGSPLGDSGDRRVIATGSFEAEGHAVAGRWDGWKYITLEDEGREELYDLDADPGERDDRSGAEPERRQHYRDGIPQFVLDGEPQGMGDVEGESVEKRLRDLGYLE